MANTDSDKVLKNLWMPKDLAKEVSDFAKKDNSDFSKVMNQLAKRYVISMKKKELQDMADELVKKGKK